MSWCSYVYFGANSQQDYLGFSMRMHPHLGVNSSHMGWKGLALHSGDGFSCDAVQLYSSATLSKY